MERRNDRLNKIKLIAGDTAADIFFERAHVCVFWGLGGRGAAISDYTSSSIVF